MTTMQSQRRPIYWQLATFGFYLLVAILITWPLVTVMSTRMAGFGYSDAYEMGHHIWWFKHALQTGQPLFYQSMMGYPDGIEGITLWAHPLQFFPAWLLAFVLPLPVAYNVMLLVSMALNGWAMWWLANYLLEGNRAAALLAGLVYMAFPTMQGHLGAGHAGLLVQWPVPLYVYALFRLRDTGERKWITLGALLFFLSATGHSLQLVYVLLPITALFWLALLTKHEWRALARVTATAGLGVVALGLFLIPIARATLDTSAYSDAGGAVRYSADLLAFATPSFLHPIFGNWEYTHRVLGINIDDGYLYVGVVAVLLAVIAAWKVRAARWWLLLAGIVYLLALGPLLKVFDQPVSVSVGGYVTGIPLPGALLDSLPFFSLARTPGRYGFTLALAMAVMAGYGFAYLWPRLRNARWAVLAVGMALILFEYQAFWPLPSVPAAVPGTLVQLRGAPDLRAVLDLPWDHLVAAKEGLFLQTEHEHPLIAGQVTRSTPVDPAKLTILQATLDPALLREAGADIVIVHREYDTDDILFERARDHLGEPMFADDRFGIFLTPESDDMPAFIALPMTQGEISSRADSYLYTPQSGWTLFSANLSADARNAVLLLDNTPIQRWAVDGNQQINVPLALTAGYHTVALAVEPPCPRVFGEALRCRALDVADLTIGEFAPEPFEAVSYGRGVTLTASRVNAPEGNEMALWLSWQFGETMATNDIRFVQVLDEAGELVAQSDITLGDVRAGEARTEIVPLTLPDDLPSGTYRVYTGWYTYPDLVRFPVISDIPGKENGLAQIGEFTTTG